MINQTTVHISLPIYNVKEQILISFPCQLGWALRSSVPPVRLAERCAPSVWGGL
ncbi:hypothetical protein [Kordiimonas lipolytica]|uniref:hypothetical protein n=1 Tax=Kordiimonas lipolytica TaxID=1662421 RepID=UPI001E4323D7|nr:hypothetical protein [Kordiimonas lipolytica]